MRAFIDAFFEVVPNFPQGRVARLDLVQHLVKAVDQLAQIIQALFGDSHGIVFLDGDGPDGLDQAEHRPRNQTLQAAGHEESAKERGDEQNGDDNQVVLETLGQVR